MNPRKNASERVHFDHGYKLAFMLKIGCVTGVFLGTLSKCSKIFFVKNIVTEFIFSMFANLQLTNILNTVFLKLVPGLK